MSYNSYNSQDDNYDDASGKNAAQAAIQRSLSEGMSRLEHHQYSDDPEKNEAKLFGLFTMDAGIVNAIDGMYTALSGEFTRTISPKLYEIVLKNGPKLKISGTALSGKALHRTAAATTLAVNMGIFLGGSVVKFTNDVIDQHRVRAQTARALAPVLDDVIGKHSVGAYNNVSIDTNSVIWAHRRRMGQEATKKNSNTVMTALAKNVINFGTQAMNFRSLATGLHREDLFLKKYEKEAEELRKKYGHEDDYHRQYGARNHSHAQNDSQAHAADEAAELVARNERIQAKVAEELHRKHDSDAGRFGMMGVNLSLPTIIGKIAESSMRRMKTSRQPYSTWEMIHCLSEQMQNNPGGDNRFQLPGKRGQELSLDTYVAEIFKQHQREMCDLSPDYSELRQSLHADLDALVKPIADSLKSGNLNPLMLVRLAGEGKVIKNHGRGLASEADVKKTLEGYEGKSHKINTVDPKEYLAERNFSLAHLKESLGSLSGDEKLDYAASFPDGVLKAAGESEKTIHAAQLHRAKLAYKHMLMHEINGMAAKTDDDLKAGGLGSSQIEQLRKAAEELSERGIDAFEALLSSPTHADGIEHTVNDFVVPKIAGDKEYLGKLVAAGKKAAPKITDDDRAGEMADAVIERASSGTSTHGNKHPRTHAKREDHRREVEYEHGSYRDHA